MATTVSVLRHREIFREYFRKITARAYAGRSGFQRLYRIIRGECVCHGRRDVDSVSGVPVGDIPCYPKHEAVIPQHLPYVKRRDGRKNGGGPNGRMDHARGGKLVSPYYRGDINHRARHAASAISVNLQLIRNCRRRRRRRRTVKAHGRAPFTSYRRTRTPRYGPCPFQCGHVRSDGDE